MRVLLLHNYYGTRGGEDEVVDSVLAGLRRRGADARLFAVESPARASLSDMARAVAIQFQRPVSRAYRDALAGFRPDLVHAHNLFPFLHLGYLREAKEHGAKTALTLHNFRHACANGLFLRDGAPCISCVGSSGWPAFLHRCYRSSFVASGIAVLRQSRERAELRRGACIDRVFVLSEFARRIAESYFDPRLIKKIGNPLPQPTTRTQPSRSGDFVFVGRLSPEKGLSHLLRAWTHVPFRLTVIGADALEVPPGRRLPNVAFLGRLTRPRLLLEMSRHKALVLPSICYENLPLAVVEAFSAGLPVLAAEHGSGAALVRRANAGATGNIFDPEAFARAAVALMGDPRRESWGKNALRYFEANHREKVVTSALLRSYERLLVDRPSDQPTRSAA